MLNPYYNSQELEFDICVFSDNELSYAFDDLLFVRTKDGRVYAASDSG